MENFSGKDKPYIVVYSHDKMEIRYFPNENPRELFWHRDLENRLIYLKYGNVKIQLDNELPIQMNEDDPIFIEKETFHRVISDSPFILKIYKY